MILLQILFSLPCSFFLGMMIPLNCLNCLGAGNSFCSLQNLHRFLLISQVTLQLMPQVVLYLSKEYLPSLHDTSSTGICETHHEPLTKLLATPTDKLPLLCAPRFCKAPKTWF